MKLKNHRWRIVGTAIILIGAFSLFLTARSEDEHYKRVVEWKQGPDSVSRQQLKEVMATYHNPSPGEFPAREALSFHRDFCVGLGVIFFGVTILYAESFRRKPQ